MSIQGNTYTFSKENVDKAPASHGVYELIRGGATIYFGRAMGDGVTIRSRLQSHQSGRDGACTQSATSYRREICSNPAAREKELIDNFVRSYGKRPACNERAV